MDFMLNSQLISRVEDTAGHGLSHALDDLQKDVPNSKAMLKHGLPWGTILETIKELEVDLVVMGTHGRHGVGHALLGSVAEKVVRLATVPVLTVHAPPTARAAAGHAYESKSLPQPVERRHSSNTAESTRGHR